MRRTTIVLLILCVQFALWGKKNYEYRYWFDGNEAMQQTGEFDGRECHIDADLRGLDPSLHYIHVQVKDTADVWSAPVTRFFVKGVGTEGSTLSYWFDDELQRRSLQPQAGGQSIDVTDVEDGLHSARFVYSNEEGFGSSAVSHYFMKIPCIDNVTLYYWMDSDFGNMKTMKVSDEAQMLDVSGLDDGFHVLYVQAYGLGSSTMPVTRMFIKVPQTDGVSHLNCMCIVDGKLCKTEQVPSEGGIVNWNLDVSEFTQGVHTLQVQVVTPSGAATNVSNHFFIRSVLAEELNSMKLVYNVDGNVFDTAEGSAVNGLYHFDLDVSKLVDGLHRITYQLASASGTSTKFNTQFFVKTPLGGNGIEQYKYWLNNDMANAVVTKVYPHVTTLSLVKLLPVAQMPIRSSCFHFELTDGEPMMYAKNDFHIIFYDASGRQTEETKQYVDYNVSIAVEDISELQTTQTFARSAENEVKWFKFEAAQGDTIALRSNQASSIQVFSPSGEEIYATSADKSMSFGGCHTWEDGTFYVAVHNVTGSKSNIILDYMHMDKYDVVSQDVKVVGNGGCSTIKFQGNGFMDLYAVDLCTEQGDSIQSIDIGHESDAETTVTFDFSGATIGEYHAVFHFTTEDKTKTKCITVEEAKDIELVTDVSYQSVFLKGRSASYTVKITNKGNMTAYMVPMEMRFRIDDVNRIKNISFDGLVNSISELNMSCLDSLEYDDVAAIQEIINNANDISQFVIFHDSISNVDYGVSQVIMTLSPNTTHQFTVTIQSDSEIYLDVWTSQQWFPLSSRGHSLKKVNTRNALSQENMCCMRERYECIADIVVNIAGFILPEISCVTSLTVTGLETAYDVWCSSGNSVGEKWQNYLNSEGNTLARRLIQTAVDCVVGFYANRIADLREDLKLASQLGSGTEAKRIYEDILACKTAMKSAVKSIYDGMTRAIIGNECMNAFRQTKPNCPPIPSGGGGKSTPVNSLDPNDIFGYTSESGSKYINDSIQHVNYRIEFENDTAFATASAHIVEVRDTLDSRLFDLATFAPTSVKIGEKTEYLDGNPNFVKTIDMRPAIDAIAQIECRYDQSKGIAIWRFTSIDPMTMEPTDDVMQGFLPVNYDGVSGMGEVSFDISLKEKFEDGTQIPNRASIIFDNNDPIETPLWINTVDAVAPESVVTDVVQVNDSIANIYVDGSDSRSDVWKYDVYVQYGYGDDWEKIAECGADSTYVSFRYYDGVDYGFCVLATDSAGNVEKKALKREQSLVKVNLGDVNSDNEVNTLDASLVVGYYLEQPVSILALAADVNGDGVVDTLDATTIIQMYLNENSSSAVKALAAKRERKVTIRTIKQ